MVILRRRRAMMIMMMAIWCDVSCRKVGVLVECLSRSRARCSKRASAICKCGGISRSSELVVDVFQLR